MTLIFIPCFNEEGRVGAVLARLSACGPPADEVLVVDDGSTDGSLAEVRSSPLRCTILRHPRRAGLGEAFRTAFRHALEGGHEVFVAMAANGKDDPVEVPALLAPILEGRADYVQGSRYHPAGGVSTGLPAHRGLAIRVFTRAINGLYGQAFTDCSNGFRAYRTALLRDPRLDWSAAWLGTSYQVEVYLLLEALRLGYRVVEVPVSKRYPADGRPRSKARAVDWWYLAKPVLWCRLGLGRRRRGTAAAVAAAEETAR